MDPPPDFGYDDYKGTGKLKNKVKCCCLVPLLITIALARMRIRGVQHPCTHATGGLALCCNGPCKLSRQLSHEHLLICSSRDTESVSNAHVHACSIPRSWCLLSAQCSMH